MRFAENMTFEEKVKQAEAELYYMDEEDRRYFAELAAKGQFGTSAQPSEEALAKAAEVFSHSDTELMTDGLEWVRQRREEQKRKQLQS